MNILIITKRELWHLFLSPGTYFTGAIFLFCTGLSFFFTVALNDGGTFAWFFYSVAVILLFVIPFLTMPLFSAEAHSGALEILLAAPVRPWEVVAGKFLAALFTFIMWLVPTLTYLLLLAGFYNPHGPTMVSGYLGTVLLGAMLISIGGLASVLFARKFVAVILTIAFSLFLWLAGSTGVNPASIVSRIFSYASIQEHFAHFVLGLITANNLIYFLTATIGFLFVTTRILETRKGR